MTHDTRTAYRARAAATERSIDAALAEVKAAEDEEREAASAAYAAKHAPVPFTADDLAAARLIRTRYGWWRILRINRLSVTIAGDFGDHRIPTKQILEVKQ